MKFGVGFIKKKIKKSKKLKEYILNIVENILEANRENSTVYFYSGRTEAFFGNRQKAEELFKGAILLNNKKWKYHAYLAKNLEDQKKWWQVIAALKATIQLNSLTANLHYRLGHALREMNHFSDAAISYGNAIELYKKHTDWMYFNYGYSLQKAGKESKANKVFLQAIKLDGNKNSEELGIGIFYEKKALWIDALKAYSEKAKLEPENALLHYKLGFSYDRNYDWKSAQKYMEYSLSLDASNYYAFYRLGFVYERDKNYEAAEKNYKIALEKEENPSPYWYYRLGYILNKQKKYKEASEILLHYGKAREFDDEGNSERLRILEEQNHDGMSSEKSLNDAISIDSSNVNLFYRLGFLYENKKEWEKAREAYQYATKRQKNFTPYWFYHLGYVLNKLGKYKEANEALLEQRILQNAHGVSERPYSKNRSLRKVINYAEYYERYVLNDKAILYESYHGGSISGNPYAIFKSLLDDKRFEGYQHIWVINDINKISNDLKSNKNIIFIKRNCDLYMRYLANTKYLINNSTFPAYYIRKERQVYLNTWHGTPIKHMGKDIKNDFMSHSNITRNFLQATHLIQPNSHTADILLERHDVDGIYNGIVAVTGYPRQDLMLNISHKEKDKLYSELNISKTKKTVLYAPTWRGIFSKANFDTIQLEKDIQTIQETENIQLLFRGHHAAEQSFNDLDLNIAVVPQSIDTNSLLSIVDILITDYSSISFDFMALGRPIVYYIYDNEEYMKERGLYFPIEELGGEVCTNRTELKLSLAKVVSDGGINLAQKKAQKQFCSYDDGKSTDRVIDLVFFGKKKNIKLIEYKKKESILLYGGTLQPNGINTSFINLVNHIDRSKYNISIVVEQNVLKNDGERLEQFTKLHKDIKVIGRITRMTITLEEHWIKNKFNSQRTLADDKMWDKYQILFKREYKRIFGYGKFDYAVEFDGYGIFWPSLFAFQSNNIIYQHNDMFGEWTLKFPTLKNVFRLYWFYETVVSVSEQTMQLNIKNLCSPFNLNQKSFTYCDNVQNPEYSLSRAKEAFENKSDEKIFINTKVFINIARLSPEKDQEKLIRAFKKVSKTHPDARLINLGSGPLEHHLQHFIEKQNLEKKVFFLGQRRNPYPYLKKSDCFILSSNHEGQPMTLFEALILEKPIIATDIVGNRSVLKGRPGLLVENSEEGLYRGMLDFLEGRYVEDKIFDYEEYNQDALNMFYEKVIRRSENILEEAL